MTLDEQIAILQAAKEGREIQVRPVTSGQWHDCDYTEESLRVSGFNFNGNYVYRVKPKDRAVYACYQEGSLHYMGSMKHYGYLRSNIKMTLNAEGELIKVELI